MNKHYRILAQVTFLGLFIVSFQNCSQNYKVGTRVSDVSSNTGLVTSDAVPASNGSDLVVNQQIPPSTPPTTDLVTSNPPVPPPSDLNTPPPAPIIKTPSVESDGDDQDLADPVKYCEKLKHNQKREHIEDGGGVIDRSGKMILSGNVLGYFSNVRGNLRIFGEGDYNSIQEIRGSRGNHIICNMDVKKLKDVRGHVVIVNGDLEDADDIIGNVTVINGRILNPPTNSDNCVFKEE